MTYAEAIQFLYGLQLFGTKFGLENTFKLAALAGNPQEKLRFIHVAGTNGKGSTCAMLESIYRAAGLRIGLFTSPHLVSFAERIQVNRELMSEENVARLVAEMKILLRQFSKNEHPTFFEVVTVMALKYFAAQKCDLVIWETGLGGRLDATNIVTPLASVITNIQLDHEKWLGDSIEKIAFEKAGIIKPNIPVITATDPGEALEVIKKRAEEIRAPLTVVSAANSEFKIQNSKLSLPGEHQQTNAALAIATAQVLNSKIPIPETAIRDGLANVYWPGRLQIIQRQSQTLLLDGAHNAASAEALRHALLNDFPAQKPTLILGILSDKSFSSICEILVPLFTKILTVPVSSTRTLAPHELKKICKRINPDAKVISYDTVAEALAQSNSDPFVVITGSLYLTGEAMELLKISPAKKSDERALNEWVGKPPD